MNFGLTIIGAGRLGGALAIALERTGYLVESVVSRSLENAQKLAGKLNSAPNIFKIADLSDFKFSNLVLIATPDVEIEFAAERLSRISIPRETIFLHTSGALSSRSLQSLQAAGGITGSIHPLVSVSDAEKGANNFAGVYFCLEGDAQAIQASEKIVAALGGNAFSIATKQKALYHAAAVMTAGHLVALFDLAVKTLIDCGIKETEAQKILLPLVNSVADNLSHQTTATALTGTFARADVNTMRKHLAALKGKPAFGIYVELGRWSLKLAAERGEVDLEKIRTMRRELEEF